MRRLMIWPFVVLVATVVVVGLRQSPLGGDALWACYVNVTGAGAGSISAAQADAGLRLAVARGCRMLPTDVTGARLVAACDANANGVIDRSDLLVATLCNNTKVAALATAFCACLMIT
jgi:hypothetical protein